MPTNLSVAPRISMLTAWSGESDVNLHRAQLKAKQPGSPIQYDWLGPRIEFICSRSPAWSAHLLSFRFIASAYLLCMYTHKRSAGNPYFTGTGSHLRFYSCTLAIAEVLAGLIP